MPLISVRHNVEMAHRLWLTPGKCQNIHGHSWQVELVLEGLVDSNGLLASMDFGDVKRVFRHYLDTTFDHRLLLNAEDPWARALYGIEKQDDKLPGLQTLDRDPTTENLARTICEWAEKEFRDTDTLGQIYVLVYETATNAARWP